MARPDGRQHEVFLRDAAERPTPNPAEAVSGELVEIDEHGARRQTRFFLTREELPWLPVSEPAFLLWVLAGLVLVWVCIGIGLLLLA